MPVDEEGFGDVTSDRIIKEEFVFVSWTVFTVLSTVSYAILNRRALDRAVNLR